MFQRTILLYVNEIPQAVFVKIDNSYYLSAFQQSDKYNISVSIDSKQRCTSVNELLNSELVESPEIRRVEHYHMIYQTHVHLICFFDEFYMCFCTPEHHANCIKFKHAHSKCRHNAHCQNCAECWQDNPTCPRVTVCSCTDRFLGNQCQFYAKGIGLTLDDILCYEIEPYTTMNDQTNLIKWSSAVTIIIFVAGLINSGLSILAFRTKSSREVGCGIYLLASPVTSFLTVFFHI
ncbi:unnamed protein product [Rotaria sp. Silwood1]|nr:unnamed protein product [Rotaria sp. Silwood1]